jgi:hypothetical protein
VRRWLAVALVLWPGVAAAEEMLGWPVLCTLGQTCFIQQFVDLDPGPDARDAACGFASYDGHTGSDIRTPQIVDLGNAGTVVAALAGSVRAIRNDSADRLTLSRDDRAAVGDQQCGNGVVIDHAGGLQTQYCHLARGSVSVLPGDTVVAGQAIGAIGLSGNTQFPHLEFIVRKDGVVVDPFSGREAGGGCDAAGAPLWAVPELANVVQSSTQLIGAGLSAAPIDHASLMQADPLPLFAGADAVVAWAWAINVRAGDLFALSFTDPDGSRFDHTSDPFARNQASRSAFAGERRAVVPGRYSGQAQLIRDGVAIDTLTFEVLVD